MATGIAGVRGVFQSSPSNIDIVKGYVRKAVGIDKVVSDKALEALGIDREDLEAKATMKDKLLQVMSVDTVFIPSSPDPGVFFAFNLVGYDGEERNLIEGVIKNSLNKRRMQEDIKKGIIPEPIAVFKMGSKRALMELTFRKIASYLGLGEYAIPGVFSYLKEPNLSYWPDEACEDLWNGNIKVFNDKKTEKGAHVVGILEPFLKPKSFSKSNKKDLFDTLIVLALATGLRDVRIDNFLSQFFDNEECMPDRLDPPKDVEKAVAATHLPCLDNALKDEFIRERTFVKIRKIVLGWKPEELTEQLKQLEVIFADEKCEFKAMQGVACKETEESEDSEGGDILFQDSEGANEHSEGECDPDKHFSYSSHEGVRIVDQGGMVVTIEEPLDEMIAREYLYTKKDLAKETSIFNKDQLTAFRERLCRLQKVFQENRALTPNQIVAVLDPFYKQHVRVERCVEEMRRASSLQSPPFKYREVPSHNRKRTHSGGESSSSLGHKDKDVRAGSSGFLGRDSAYLNPGRTPVSTELMSPHLNSPRFFGICRQLSTERQRTPFTGTPLGGGDGISPSPLDSKTT